MFQSYIKSSFVAKILTLFRTSFQNGLDVISYILSMKSVPNLKRLYSSKSSGMLHHLALDLIYFFSQPFLMSYQKVPDCAISVHQIWCLLP